MKKLILSILMIGFLAACSTKVEPEVVVETPKTEEATVQNDAKTGLPIDAADGLILFTLEDLAKYDGLSGNDAYVAVNGNVYDVTGDRKWTDGSHYEGMVAGKDLTEFIASAPHGEGILSEYTVIGKIVN